MMNRFFLLLLLLIVALVAGFFLGFFDGLAYLLGQMLWCLVIAALLGLMLGWLLKGLFGGGDASLVADLESQLLGRERELLGFRSKVNTQESELETANASLASLNEQIKGLETSLKTKDAGYDELEAKLKGLEAEVSGSRALQGELDAKDNLVSQLNAKLQGLEADKTAEITKLQQEIKASDQAKTELLELQGKLASMQKDLGQKDARIAELEEKGQANLAEVESGQALQAKLDAKDQLVTELNTKLSSLEADKNAEISKLKQELDASGESKSSLLELQGQFASLQKDIAVRDERILELENQGQEAKDANTAKEALQAQLTTLQASLMDRDNRIADLENDMGTAGAVDSDRYSLQDPNVQLRFLGERIRLRGSVTHDVRAELIENAVATYGQDNIIDELVSNRVVSSPEWVKPFVSSALPLGAKLQDADLKVEDYDVILRGIVADAAVKDEVGRLLTDNLPPSFKLKNQLQVLGQDAESDDLKEIKGINTVLESILHSLGVYTFRQIATWTPADREQVRTSLQQFKTRIERDKWLEQAKKLHKQKYNEDI